MKHLKLFEEFVEDKSLTSKQLNIVDDKNYWLIFDALVESHLSIQEKNSIICEYEFINESWFSELKDKAARKVLKVKNVSGEILVNLAQKAKDILDFAKQLANQIGAYVKSQFMGLTNKVKSYAMKDNEFGLIILDFLKNKKNNKLREQFKNLTELIKYIISGEMISDLIDRLSELFSKVLNLGANEGISHLENEFLCESEESGEKKPFLQRLGEKIMNFSPFNWIPKMEEMLGKGISSIRKIVDRFFSWLTTGKDNLVGSKFIKGFIFLFQIVELYIHFKVVGKIDAFKKFLNDEIKDTDLGDFKNDLDDLTNKLKDKALDEIFNVIGFNKEEILSGVKNAVKKIPYVGRFLSIIETLTVWIGIYLSVEPVIKKFDIQQ